MKIEYALSQVKFYRQSNYRSINKLNWTPPVILNNKLLWISLMCYSIIINQFQWFWKVQSYILLNTKTFSVFYSKKKKKLSSYSTFHF